MRVYTSATRHCAPHSAILFSRLPVRLRLRTSGSHIHSVSDFVFTLLLIYSSHSWGSSCFGLCNQHVSNSNFGLSDSPGLQFPESGSFYSPVQLYVIDLGCSDFGIVILPVSPTVFELASPGFRSFISPVTAVQASMNSSASSSLPAVK